MKHHRASHVDDCLDGSFADTVLKACVGSTETDCLVLGVQSCNEIFCGKCSSVAVVAVDGDTIVESFLLEGKFGLNGVGCI